MMLKTLLTTTLLSIFTVTVEAITPSRGCTTKPITLGEPDKITNHTLTINTKERYYLLNIPPSYTSYSQSTPPRLIFTLHAAGGNSSMVADGIGGYLPWYGIPSLLANTTSTSTSKDEDDPGAIYVAPNGLDRGWANRGDEDVEFITAIAKEVKSRLCVDEDLVFSVGFSYGASMSYALACASSLGTRDSLKLRAVGVQSGGNMSGCASGDKLGPRPVALYGQHGVDGDLNITVARKIRDQFVENNGCTSVQGEQVVLGTGGHKKVVYEGCKEDLPVTWVEYDGGHTPQPRDVGAAGTWAGEETWRFFSQFK